MLLLKYDPGNFVAIHGHHLHSIMLLLKCFWLTWNLVDLFIYIPLCFYLNIFSLTEMNFTSFIYIPLCFYLNGKTGTAIRMIGVIYIPLCFYLNSYISPPLFASKFNLHSIMLLLKLNQMQAQYNQQPNLHSIMLLLKCPTTLCYTIPVSNLHSIMLLLKYIMQRFIESRRFSFTFHYAST